MSSEYSLVVAVIVVAVSAAAYTFAPTLSTGVESLADSVFEASSTGNVYVSPDGTYNSCQPDPTYRMNLLERIRWRNGGNPGGGRC